jgi:HD-GYP domain-containing protein (c-di-GMP phosphodiesterase class II)
VIATLKRSQHAHAPKRRFVLACGLIPTIIVAILALVRPGFLTGLDYAVYDRLVRRAGTTPPGGQVAIVDIDEQSLAEIGQWPWRRDTIGRLVDRLHELGATIVALDVMFPESDRHDQVMNAADTGRGATGTSGGALSLPDARLAETLRRGRVVLGYAFTFEPSMTRPSACELHPLGLAVLQPEGEEGAPLFRASGAICSLPALAQAAGASGFMNARPDRDGILRRVPLLIERDGRVYPGLALAAVAAATGTRDVALRVVNIDTASLTLDRRVVPLDGKGNLLVRYRGIKHTFPYVPAADVLFHIDRVPVDTFRDKLVFVGATALGTREVVATPLDTLFAGVEVQATVADNLLTQDFIRRPEYGTSIEALAALGAGSAVVFVVATAGSVWGSLAALVSLAILWGGVLPLLSVAGVFLSPMFATEGVILALASTTIALERRRAEQAGDRHATSQRLMVQTLLSLVEIRDAETGQHSRRTQRYARLLAEHLSRHPRFRDYLTPERIDLLASLAPLHDIGKVGIPDHVLNKPGKLTPDEFAEMRKHPVHGRDVIVQAEHRVGAHDDAALRMAKDIVYTHHERWDGSGYPQGLADEQIPIPGRLVAIVDMYDALVTSRVYRGPLPHDKAVDLIVQGRGTQFDPAVVDAFLQVVPALRDMSAAR